MAQRPTGFEVGSLLLAEMFAEGKNEVDLISEDHQEPTKIGHFLPVSMSKTPPADPGGGRNKEMCAMSRARRDRDDWDVGAPPAPAYGDVPTIPDLSAKPANRRPASTVTEIGAPR
jgi:hypothetical protein